MPFSENGGIRYLTFDSLPAHVVHGVISRRGGVSPMPWESLNVGGTVGDEKDRVLENRRLSFGAFDRPMDSMFHVWQVHSVDAVCADAPVDAAVDLTKADIILTDRPDVTLYMRFADCVPLLFHDPAKQVVGLAHAGWLGTVRGAGRTAVQTMQKRYGSHPEDILAAIGPSIGPDHYEVGPDVIARVQDAFGKRTDELIESRQGRTYLDLWAANRVQLERAGVTQIENPRVCTACHLEDWFSHRAEKGRTGRFGALIALQA
jgi:YfiH family protein